MIILLIGSFVVVNFLWSCHSFDDDNMLLDVKKTIQWIKSVKRKLISHLNLANSYWTVCIFLACSLSIIEILSTDYLFIWNYV